jgi:hypothetical protein
MEGCGKWMVIGGMFIAAAGALIWVFEKVFGIRLGRLPGDIAVERDGVAFHLPLTSMLLASVLLSLILWAVSALRR